MLQKLKDIFLKPRDPRIMAISLSLVAVFGGSLIYFVSQKGLASLGENFSIFSFEIEQEEEEPPQNLSPITGEECENHERRPFAVMLPTDPTTRPISGISKADAVFELPVTMNGITRLMGVFNCEEPDEIGSVRSARHDFIPIAASVDGILAHWGGSYIALERFDAGMINNLNALHNPAETFYRKPGIPRPHNGFTSYDRLKRGADNLNYRTTNNFEGFKHKKDTEHRRETAENNEEQNNADNPVATSVSVQQPGSLAAQYIYNEEKNIYGRLRGGTPETDALNNQQVELGVVIVMRTNMRSAGVQYNDVDVFGTDEVLIFQNGKKYRGTWENTHDPLDSEILFRDNDGEDIRLMPGKKWIHFVTHDTPISWE